jgi:NADH:ubiquinone oxidoreductase subunit 2 (subunit N)
VLFLFYLISLHFFRFERFQLFEFVFLILFSVIGMFVAVMANNFFVFYMALELQSFCFYVLAAMRRYSNLSVEAALKYFILGAFSSSVFLFGSSLLYGSLGTLNFGDIELLISSFNPFLNFNKLVFLGALFILVGFFFKLGIVPFHF